MAKIRVYELAKELNLSNKVLLGKLKKVNISVKSHMSSLDDEDVASVKDFIFGKADNGLDEKRVKPSVIRRRKKKAAPEPPEAEVTEEIKEEAPAVSEPEPRDIHAAADQQDFAPSGDDQPEPVKPKVIAKKAKPAKIVTPAKIIKPAKTADPVSEKKPDDGMRPEAEEDTPKISEPVKKAEIKEADPVGAEPVSVEEKPEDVKAGMAEESSKRVEEKTEAAMAPPEAEAVKPVGPESVTAPEADSEKAAPKPVKKKKQKKSNAAKIIKLPSMVPPVKPKAAASPSTAGPSKKFNAPKRDNSPGMDVHEKRGKDARKKVWASEDAGPSKKFPKKKSSFRKKSVVEGKALYGKGRYNKGRKGGKVKAPAAQKTLITTPKAIKRRIKVDDAIILAELAKRMGIKANEMIQKLMGMGVMATVNQTIDYETAALVATEFGYEVERAAFEEENLFERTADTPEQLIERPPVVTIMGHVDHGKTSLLDVIRKTRVTDAEAGGITQHIGAYLVGTPGGQIAFLDTPGHEAFTAMRSRGARVTDIVILVVAADDGVMPQTIEAINHSKAAEVPVIVAINKMDKPDADPERVKRELSEYGIVAEEWGGDAIFVNVSAKENTGVDELLEMVLLQSEVQELKANPDKLAKGHVVEAKLDSGRGPVATILVQEGTLKAGDPVVCGLYFGKIRAMVDDRNRTVSVAGPSMPVEIIGLSGVPEAGDELVALSDEKDAKQVSAHRAQKQRATELARSSRLNLEGLFAQMEMGEVKDLNLILKADVHGSIEALKDSLTKLTSSKVKVNIVHSATGTVSESDVSLATVSNAIILGFNVRPGAKVHELAKEEMVDMRFYDVIYDAIKDVKNAMVGLMDSTFKEVIIGRADVRDTFVIPKIGTIAGAHVTDGKIQRGQSVRLLREGVIKCDGKLSSLKRFKDDVKEVQHGYECGIGIENYNDIKVGDTIECYLLEEIKPTLE